MIHDFEYDMRKEARAYRDVQSPTVQSRRRVSPKVTGASLYSAGV